MVDSVEHLDLIEAAVGGAGAPVRVCLDFDASLWLAGGRVKVGPKRTPVHTVAQARALAQEIVRRRGVRAGRDDELRGPHRRGRRRARGPARAARAALSAACSATSYAELRARRAAAIAAVREVAELELVNGGGTGDLHLIAERARDHRGQRRLGLLRAAAVRRLPRLHAAAGRDVRAARHPPARRARTVTALGGRLSRLGRRREGPHAAPVSAARASSSTRWRARARCRRRCTGRAARRLRLGENVYFRHVKAGELCEHFDRLYLVEGSRIVEELPTYRGEGKTLPVSCSELGAATRRLQRPLAGHRLQPAVRAPELVEAVAGAAPPPRAQGEGRRAAGTRSASAR